MARLAPGRGAVGAPRFGGLPLGYPPPLMYPPPGTIAGAPPFGLPPFGFPGGPPTPPVGYPGFPPPPPVGGPRPIPGAPSIIPGGPRPVFQAMKGGNPANPATCADWAHGQCEAKRPICRFRHGN